MQYLTKEKFSFAFLSPEDLAGRCILVFEPESSLLGIYAKHFSSRKFTPYTCRDMDELSLTVNSVMFKAVVIGLSDNSGFPEILSRILFIKNKFNLLPIISYAYNLSAERVKQLMAAGVSSHLDRKFSRPGDLVDLVEALVN